MIGIRRRAIDRDHSAKRFAMHSRIAHHIMSTHRMANQDRRTSTPRPDNGTDVRDIMSRAVTPFLHPFAVAVAALIEGKHVMRVDQRRRDKIPPARMGGAAVN